MRSLKHINAYLYLHGKRVSKEAVDKFLSILQADINSGLITRAKDKFHKEVDRIQRSLVGMSNAMFPGEVAKIEIEAPRKKHYEGIVKAKGLGNLRIVTVGAIAGAVTSLTAYHIKRILGVKEPGLGGLFNKEIKPHKNPSSEKESIENEWIYLGIKNNAKIIRNKKGELDFTFKSNKDAKKFIEGAKKFDGKKTYEIQEMREKGLIGKSIHFILRKTKNSKLISQSIEGIDSISLKEAKALGITTSNLGFVEKDIFKQINKQILTYLETENDLPWRKPWRDGYKIKGKTYGSQNYVTTHPYRGANAYIISLMNLMNGTNWKYFLTKKQIHERGGKINKGAKPIDVFVFIKGLKKEKNKAGKETQTEYKGIITYEIYPLEYTEGVKPIKHKIPQPEGAEEVIIDAETLIDNMPKKPVIKNDGGNKAFYSPTSDSVHLPVKKSFDKIQKYYGVAFHELIHSTGHKNRLGRDLRNVFGSKKYAFEELIAEVGSAYLCGVTGMEYHTLKNSAAYIKSWASSLRTEIRTDKMFLFRAILSATKASKYIIGETLIKKGEVSIGGKKTVKKESKSVSGTKKVLKKLKPIKNTGSLGTISKTVDEVLENHFKNRSGSKNFTKYHSTKALPGLAKNDVKPSVIEAVNTEEVKHPSPVSTLGTVSAEDMGNMTFEKLNFSNHYKTIFGTPATNFDMCIDGSPGCGKTVFLLQFANYLADYHGLTLFISTEEFGSATLIDKIKRFGINSKNLRFAKKVPAIDELKNYKFVFIDSINHAKITIEQYQQMREKAPNTSFVLVLQQTKGGSYKGSTDWPHEVEITMSLGKNEFDEREVTIKKDRYTDPVPRVVKI